MSSDNSDTLKQLLRMAQEQQKFNKRVAERLEGIDIPHDVDEEDNDGDQADKPSNQGDDSTAASTWDSWFPKATITPDSETAKKILASLKAPPDTHGVNAILKDLPKYEGMLQISVMSGSGQTALVAAQKRLLEMLRVIIAGADNLFEHDQTMGICAGLARTAFDELERARKLIVVRGNAAVLEPAANAPPALLSEKEQAALAAARRGRGAGGRQGTGGRGFQRRYPANPKAHLYNHRGRGRTSGKFRGSSNDKPQK